MRYMLLSVLQDNPYWGDSRFLTVSITLITSYEIIFSIDMFQIIKFTTLRTEYPNHVWNVLLLVQVLANQPLITSNKQP